jgi:hypothetical protein
MKWYNILLAGLIISSCNLTQKTPSVTDSRIKPWQDNPRYWQYKGQPVLLLGGTITDNLFQIDHLESHLDSLQAIGGNYVRNTMSDRDEGNKRAFFMRPDGKYDLDRWNDEYWSRFENLLKLAGKRDIIVQIEIWDRFDHSRDEWITDPYNPGNNINYTYAETGLDSHYPEHPGRNLQPFFFTVPELDNNQVLLKYQKAFVRKLLDISLQYGNVLYCIDNETSGVEEWATFWAEFIYENSQGQDIYLTQMWDHWNMMSDEHKRTIDHPERYGYIDISQNSHNAGRLNWDNAQYVLGYISDNPRPVNSTKIYGNDGFERWLNRGITTEHALQTFFRNILGGFASSRYHRPPAGLGLSELSINSIRTIRKIEEYVKMWEITPRMELLQNAEDNQAYLSAKEGDKYVIYFPKGGNIRLDMGDNKEEFIVRWITTEDAQWGPVESIRGGGLVDLGSGEERSCLAVIIKK